MSLHRDLRHLRHDVPNDVPQRWSHLPSAHYQEIKMRSLSCLLFALLHFAQDLVRQALAAPAHSTLASSVNGDHSATGDAVFR